MSGQIPNAKIKQKCTVQTLIVIYRYGTVQREKRLFCRTQQRKEWKRNIRAEGNRKNRKGCTWKAGSMDPDRTTTMGDSLPVTTIRPFQIIRADETIIPKLKT